MIVRNGLITLAALACLAGPVSPSVARDTRLIATPSADTVRARVLDWVAARKADDRALLEQVGKTWAFESQHPAAHVLFDQTIETFVAVDQATAEFVAACRLDAPAPQVPDVATLDLAAADPFYRANMNAYCGRFLAQRRMYDEALEVLSQVDLQHAVDPAASLFYRAVCEHGLLLKDDGLSTLEQLLQQTEAVPERYNTIATLMRYDLEALEDKSLDEVARKMSDVERRLRLGRGGQRVQKVEEEIVATLDEIIKKLEGQGGGGGGGGGGGNQNESMNPANDSVVKGSTAPGEVDEKDIGNKSGWGDLPAKEQADAKNLINKMYPAHYIRAIEEYNRRLATRPAEPADR